jgi:hypothetical protein
LNIVGTIILSEVALFAYLDAYEAFALKAFFAVNKPGAATATR